MAIKLANIQTRPDLPEPRIALGKGSGNMVFQEVLTQAEAARYLRIGIDLLCRLTKENVIPARCVGGRTIYGRDALKRWVNNF